MAITFPILDLVQRIVIGPWSRLRGPRGQNLLSRWKSTAANITLGIVCRVGGARLFEAATIPGREGVLVVANHQSLLDIPLIVKSMTRTHPLFVTRRRYARGIPLVSHMLRLYGHPLVDPGRRTAEQLEELRMMAQNCPQPLAIFPEGTRTRNGQIGRFRRAGLRAILESREWEVYVVVADGMWKCARIHDFVHTISSVEIRMQTEGPIRFRPDQDDTESFINDLHHHLESGLARLRESEEAVTS